MSATYRILLPDDLGREDVERRTFSLDVLLGLSETPKRLNSKYFYDDQGSELFQKIMNLSEYYLTDAEFDVFNTLKSEISKELAGGQFKLVELGAGDGQKTRVLLEQFLQDNHRFEYVPVDISEGAMSGLADTISTSLPQLEMRGLVADYFDALKFLAGHDEERTVVFFLGSNLGNFQKAESRVFLRSLWNMLKDGDQVMIGFDLKKDIDMMLKAYNDSEGVTAAFNLNLLQRINRELGANFDLDKFVFYSSYNVFSGAIESYLVSMESQEVFIADIGQQFFFRAWEPIHTEYSYKYLISDIESLAVETGYQVASLFYDTEKRFVDALWRVEKSANR